LSGTLSDIHFLVGMVTVHPENVNTFSTILSGSLDECVRYANPDQKEVFASITLFSDTGKKIIEECLTVEKQIKTIEITESMLNHSVSTLENTLTPQLISSDGKRDGNALSFSKQISASIPDMITLLLRIKIFLLEARLDYSYQGLDAADNESDIIRTVGEFEKAISPITETADERIAVIGREMILRFSQYRSAISTLYATLGILEKTLHELNEVQTQVTTLMSTTDQDIIQDITRMREGVVLNLKSAYTLTIVLSLIGFSVIVFVAFYGVKIVKPIQKLTRSAKEMAEGNLDTDIPLNGSDESGRLASSFLKMRDAIRQKMTDLAGKNDELHLEITERRRAEDELRKYERIVSTSGDLIVLVDKEVMIHAVNDAFLESFQKKRADVLGRPLSEIMGEGFFDEQMKPYLHACLKGEENHFQEWFLFPENVRRYMDVGYYPYVNTDEEVSGVVINARDITRVKDLETQLLHAQKLKAIGTLAGGIAHDFNNILSAIIGYTELSQLDTEGKPKLNAHLGEVLKAAGRARDLVRQIMLFSRQNDIHKSPIKIAPVIHEALKMLRASIPKTIEIVKDIECEPGTVLADPTQIHQIVINLCTNAAHAMREKGGALQVSLKNREVTRENRHSFPPGLAQGSYLELAIRDTGAGIEESLQERIFEPYYTTKEKSVNAGTGLGLATVHGIVQNCGGKIDFESTLGVGTRFRILFPRTDLKEAEEEKPQGGLVRGKGRILLVDDELSLVEVGRDMLNHLGYEVSVKTDPREALELFKSSPGQFDLIITDQTMPHITGDQLAKTILAIRPGMPIILYTGFSEKIDELHAKQIGIREFILKPLEIRKLAASIQSILGNG
jgi:PAS domain S-box-containing protein